ncbi:hypothetical protein [Archangium lansingense]|uniref:Uncharacterized protein n=1 Tax=Archangium lansingense TaxID=2995310 RepID=A0ABT3ZV09_9BACT|nr:hypothetical protein [Archangium lansinium]MCY1073243.1 hypothetical protein [Archangium lansinium]
MHDEGSNPGPSRILIEQAQAIQECPRQQGSLTLEAFSRMAIGGVFSVWHITGSVTKSPEVQALRSFIGYHSTRPSDSSQTHVLLQVELTLSAANGSQRVTMAKLVVHRKTYTLQVWQPPASEGEEHRLLLEGFVDIHNLQSTPHKLTLSGGEQGSVKMAILENIMIR